MDTHQCSLCKNTFEYKTSQDYLKQMMKKTSDGDHIIHKPCVACIKFLVLKTISSSETPICFICNKKCFTIQNAVNHVRYIHIELTPWKCDLCDLWFKDSKNLMAHMLDGHNYEDVDMCIFCEKMFTKKHLYYHKVYTHEHFCDMYLCDFCGRKYTSRGDFTEHMQRHNSSQMYECEICDKGFAAKSALGNHKRYMHKPVKPEVKPELPECQICQKSVHNIKIHMKTHEVNVEMLKCSYCSKEFRTKSGLRKHVDSIHEKFEDYICDVCGKSFLKALTLSRHKLIHSGVKRYKCASCGLSFNQKCTLTRHQVVHTGEKPFECGICGQRFTQKPYMQKHQEKCGKEKPETNKNKETKNMRKLKAKTRKRKREESSEESEEISETENEETTESGGTSEDDDED